MTITNFQPSLALNLEMSKVGIYPSRESDDDFVNVPMATIRTYAFSYGGTDTVDTSGQLLAISTNPALFSLVGISFGGDGMSTFGVPDLIGKVMVDADTALPQGYSDGATTITLGQQAMPTSNGGGGQALNNLQPEVAVTTALSIYPADAMRAGAVIQFAGSFVPAGYIEARGQTLSIQSYPDLFAAIGTTYGGNGTTTFNLPNIDGRTIVGVSDDVPTGTLFGSDYLTVTDDNLPVSSGGSGEAIDNSMPSIALSYMISVSGLYPTLGGYITSMDGGTIGEIMAFAGDVSDMTNWLPADGRLLAVADYTALYSLIGNLYGGDGLSTFALPDLRGRAVIGSGSSSQGTYTQGQVYGSSITLTADDMPDMVINGTNASETLRGADGDDVIFGNAGDDVIDGSAGNDTLVGGLGGDQLSGNGSTTVASYSTATAGVTADLADANNNTGDASGDTYHWITNLTGSSYDDTLVGDVYNNVLVGGAGNDTLSGNGSFNTLTGGAGNDVLVVTTGYDTVTDFTIGADTIKSASLEGVTTLAEILARVNTSNHGNAVFSFTNGSSLTLTGVDYSNLTLSSFALAPVITSGSGSTAGYGVDESGTGEVATIAVTDGNGGAMTFAITGGADASLFTIDSATGVLTFNTPANYEAPTDTNGDNVYNIIVKVKDSSGLSDSQTITITVADINEAPTGSLTGTLTDGVEDTAYTVTAASLLAGFSDDDGDNISLSNLAASGGATVTDNQDGTFTITPVANFNGAITLSYSVSDGVGGSVSASRSLTLASVNDVPTGTATAVFTGGYEDNSYTISASDLLLGFSDGDNDTLSVTSLAADGNAQVQDNNDGTYTIIPDADFHGTVTLTYLVVDAHSTSVAGSVDLTFETVNDGPSGAPTAVFANGTEDTAYTVSAADLLIGFSDLEGDALSVDDLLASDGATVTDNGDGTYKITPAANFSGVVTLTYNVVDALNGLIVGVSNTVTFEAVNDSPISTSTVDLEPGLEGNTYTVAASDLLLGFSDADLDTLSVSGLTASGGATVTNNGNGTYTITPAANFVGTVTLSYSVIDGHGGTAAATASLAFEEYNNVPTGAPTATFENGTEDGAYTVSAADLLQGFSDIDLDTLSISGLTSSDGGTVTNNGDGTFTITPAQNFHGTATLSYNVIDGHGGVVAATRSVTFDAVNDAPAGTATAVLDNAIEDSAYTVSAATLVEGFSDAELDTLYINGLTASGGATVTNNGDGTFTITPVANFNGVVTLSYNVIDGLGGVIATNQSVTFEAVNDVPTGTAMAVLADGAEDTAYTVSAATLLEGFADADLETLSVDDLEASNGATVTDNGDGTFKITPVANFHGVVTLSYSVVDGHGGTVAGSRSVTFDAVNDAPTGAATATFANGTEDGAYSVSAAVLLQGFADADLDTLSINGLTGSGGATVVDNGDGTFTITPGADFNGVMTLSYNVIDGNGGTIAGSRSIAFDAVNDIPVVAEPIGEQTAGIGEVLSLVLPAGTFGDADGGDALVYTATLEDGSDLPSWLSFDPDTLTLSGTPSDEEKGTLSIRITATDGVGESVSDVFDLVVEDANVVPTGSATAVLSRGKEDVAYTVTAANLLAGFTDADGDTLSVLDIEASAGATVIDNEDGTFTISTVENFNGSVALNYTVSDGRGGTIEGSRSVIFDAVSDAPWSNDNTISAVEDKKYTFVASDFGFFDVDGDAFASVIITSLPTEGTLTLGGVKVTANQSITVARLDELVWKPAKDASGDALTEMEFKVRDNGATLTGGANLETTTHTLTFDVSNVVDTFNGTKKADKLEGTDGADILIGKAGNDKLTGDGGSDTFVFKAGEGKDTITDFTAAGDDHDIVDLSKVNAITDYEDLLANHVKDKAGDLVISLGHGDQITLKDIQIGDLDASQFQF